VFHVSQLKKKVGLGTNLLAKLPLIGPKGTTLLNPIAILDRRVVKKNNAVAVEILVEWANLPVEEATWEDYHFIREQFSENCLEDDKIGGKGIVSTCNGKRWFGGAGSR
jgi:Chromo (CHRromatin Organisation MOdifier) domain